MQLLPPPLLAAMERGVPDAAAARLSVVLRGIASAMKSLTVLPFCRRSPARLPPPGFVFHFFFPPAEGADESDGPDRHEIRPARVRGGCAQRGSSCCSPAFGGGAGVPVQRLSGRLQIRCADTHRRPAGVHTVLSGVWEAW